MERLPDAEVARRLRLLAEQSMEHAFLFLDPDGRIAWWSRGAEELFGHGSEEIAGQPVDVLFADEDRAAGIPHYERAVAQGGDAAEDDRDEALLRIEDNGVGIPSDMLPRIFELFTQVDSSRHQSGGGLGIGLALVKDLVALHGGSVQVRSDGPGKGSEFTVRLPLKRPPR